MLVYLADLRHHTITLTPDAMPLGIGFLAGYAGKTLGPDVELRLFADPEQLMEELRDAEPDVLGVTNYCWNYALNSHMLRYARGLYPELLTVMGGPNLALDHAGEERRLRETPCLDIYVINEGELPFVSLLRRYLESDLKKPRLFQEALPSSIFTEPEGGQIVRGSAIPRLTSLDEIPSPYLTGLMDPFFDGAFCPMIQTNRGCPFTCTFCVEGVSYMTKVNKFPLDRVQAELEYIAHHARIGNALMISDSNFGMLPGDLDTAQSIHELQVKLDWPRFVWATTGKNNKDSILSAIGLLEGTMSMTNSVQSMDPEVLSNIKRSNIKLETYAAILEDVKARNLQSYAEVIIGLPGETKESFFRGVCQLLDSGVHRVCCYQLMLLDGTELSDEKTRHDYGLNTKFRGLSRDLGIYAGEPIFELEEVVVSTNALSSEDYMDCRKLQLIMEVYHREGLLRELIDYVNSHDVPTSVYIMDLVANLDDAPEQVKSLLAEYLREAQVELFDSPEEARKALAMDYQKYVEEEEGGNLVQKYSALAWFKTLAPILRYSVQRSRALILEKQERQPKAAGRIDAELEAIYQYLLSGIINIGDFGDHGKEQVATLEYDVEAWRKQGYKQPVSKFRHQPVSGANGAGATREYVFYVPEEHVAYLEDKLSLHGTSSQALGKLLSRVLLRDLRRHVRPLEAPVP